MKKSKKSPSTKEPFFNVLLRFLRKCKIKFTTFNGYMVHITTGALRSCRLYVDRTRIAVDNLKSRTASVQITIDFLVNYSIEVFLYKMYRFHFIDEAKYNYLLRLWQNA